MHALVVAHDHVSPAGHVGQALRERGYDLVHHRVVPADRHARPDVETDFPDFTAADLVVLLGAPWSVYDRDRIGNWLAPEQQQIRAADAAGVPILGICFGGQLLADTFGGSVAASPEPEIGWSEVASDDESIVPAGPWFQWHSDRWTLPPGATEIARNRAASQAFRLGRHLAVQFHPELTASGLEGWIENGGRAALRERGLDPAELVARTRAVEERSRARTDRLVGGFLAHLEG
ncbi:type 1 glutamine amidotransferase [Nocardioides sp.]|uniref:type 1 glutamine amidotransferase n=1 Tax=Nocardioides sp. TaxID=35761 RepID=UPI00351980AF